MAYSMILADTFSTLFKTIGYVTVTRNQALLGVTGLGLLPLCLLKDLSSLAPFSALGSAGMMYTSVVMAVRYFGGGYAVPGGKFLADLGSNVKPLFGTRGARADFSPNAFILVCMLSTAFNAHFNAPKFYDSLKNKSVKRFNKVVFPSFAVAIGIFSFIAGMGFLTFGKAANGFILNNYSTEDTLMGVSRLAVALSILFS
jgi:amino acid permease